MSIATELSRIQTDRNTIRTKLVELGLATSTDNLDELAAAIEEMVNCGAVSIEIKEGQTYTIPKGYHPGTGKVVGIPDTEKYKTQTKSVTPTKNAQTIKPDSGYYALSSVAVAAIPSNYQDTSKVTAAAGDVLSGKIIVLANGTVVTGTMANNGKISKTIDGISTTSVTLPAGYISGGTVSLTMDIENALAAI